MGTRAGCRAEAGQRAVCVCVFELASSPQYSQCAFVSPSLRLLHWCLCPALSHESDTGEILTELHHLTCTLYNW